MKYNECISMLTPLHGKGEATAIVRTVMEERFGLSLSDLLLCKDTALSANEHHDLEKIMQELLSGTPVQYVLGSARFCGRPFSVTPDVLIPRPETEQLVTLLPKGGVVADLGTGSGCIAVSVALDRDPKQVIAIDVSEKAIEVAKKNAKTHAADVDFILQDMLDIEATCNSLPQLDCIVSNPPYIRQSEATEMSSTVTAHEPSIALFVPDDDPLLFYRAIGQIATRRLRSGGLLAVEANTALTTDVAALFKSMKFQDISIIDDCFGKPRFVTAISLFSRKRGRDELLSEVEKKRRREKRDFQRKNKAASRLFD